MSAALRRVIHVVDPSASVGGACTLRLASGLIDGSRDLDHVVLALGHGVQRRIAQRCGLRPDEMVPVPAGSRALLGWRVAGSACAPWPPRCRVPDSRSTVVLAWSARAVEASSLLVGDVAGIAAWLGTASELRLATRTHGVRLLMAGVESGAEACDTGCDCIEPGVEIRLVEPGVSVEVCHGPSDGAGTDVGALRADLHRRWGRQEGELVVALAVDPCERGDARLACYAAAIACVAGRRCRVLLHPRARAAERWRAWSHSTGLLGAAVLEPELEEPWRIAAGLDVALCVGTTPGRGSREAVVPPGETSPLPVMELMACGVPVIVDQIGNLPVALRERAAESLIAHVPVNDRVAIAGLLMQLHDDAASRKRMGDASRCAVKQWAPRHRFVAAIRQALEELPAHPLLPADHSARNVVAAS